MNQRRGVGGGGFQCSLSVEDGILGIIGVGGGVVI